MEELVICCMDRRLNDFLEKEYNGAFVFRNAGANVAPLIPAIKQIVKENDIGTITLITHDDCGAMKKTFAVIKEGAEATEELKDELINQFNEVDFNTRSQLEEKNTELQLDRLKNEFPNIKVQAKPVRMSDLKIPEDTKEHKLLVISPGKPEYGKAFKGLGLAPSQCYIVQASISNAMPDMELAAKDLHAKEAFFIVSDKDNPRDVKRDADTASLKLSRDGAEVKRYDARTVRKSLA
ncbi:MAG: carbonic anhydrase [Methanothrix sp.]